MEMREVVSSNIHSAGYDPETRVMRVRFHDRMVKRSGETAAGGVYEHLDVPQEAFDAFMAAGSKGSHYAGHIRRTGGDRGYEHRRIDR